MKHPFQGAGSNHIQTGVECYLTTYNGLMEQQEWQQQDTSMIEAKGWTPNFRGPLIPGRLEPLSLDTGLELMTVGTQEILAIYNTSLRTMVKIKLLNQDEYTNNTTRIIPKEQHRPQNGQVCELLRND